MKKKFVPRPISAEQAAQGYNNEGRGKLVGYIAVPAEHEQTCRYRMTANKDQHESCSCRIGLWQEDLKVASASDQRTVNNAVRHQYRVLSDAEKVQMVAIKDKGAEFLGLLDEVRRAGQPYRDLEIAAERVQEAVMWAVRHITA